jgi:hypothetical protein
VGWLDHIIFGMGPLGILTAVVGAIRVAGPQWLKGAIGRGRETRAAVEVELLSSASNGICEVWNGEMVERVVGSATVQLLLYFESREGPYTGVTAGAEGLIQLKRTNNPPVPIQFWT